MANRMFGAVLALVAIVAGCSMIKKEEKSSAPTAATAPAPAVAQVFPSPSAGTNPQLFGKPPYSFNLDESLDKGESVVIAGPKKATPPRQIMEKVVAAAPVVAASAVASSTPAWPPSALSAADEVVQPMREHRVPPVGPRGLFDTFGYEGNSLVYSPWFGGNKVVHMAAEELSIGYTCTARLPETKRQAQVIVKVVANPSRDWEKEFHRRVAIHGNANGQVTAVEVKAGVTKQIGRFQELICAEVGKKSVKDLIQDPSLGLASRLNALIEKEQSPFEMMVQATEMVRPKEYILDLALEHLNEPPPKQAGKKI